MAIPAAVSLASLFFLRDFSSSKLFFILLFDRFFSLLLRRGNGQILSTASYQSTSTTFLGKGFVSETKKKKLECQISRPNTAQTDRQDIHARARSQLFLYFFQKLFME